MDLADIRPGMTVADIGAGEGYYTVRLAERVGADGRVLAQDISREALERLGRRVEKERLENISIKLGEPADPQLPADSFDRIFMVHMYHEVTDPYAFLWRMWPALNAEGQIIVVESDSPSGVTVCRTRCCSASSRRSATSSSNISSGPTSRDISRDSSAVPSAPSPTPSSPATSARGKRRARVAARGARHYVTTTYCAPWDGAKGSFHCSRD